MRRTDGSSAELEELVMLLDDDRRAAFVLTQLHGMRYDEAATLLEVPIGTIRSRVSRAREQLVAALRAADSGEPAIDRPAHRSTGPEPPGRLGRPHG